MAQEPNLLCDLCYSYGVVWVILSLMGNKHVIRSCLKRITKTLTEPCYYRQAPPSPIAGHEISPNMETIGYLHLLNTSRKRVIGAASFFYF